MTIIFTIAFNRGMQNKTSCPRFQPLVALVLTLAAVLIAGCASERRQTVSAEAAPGYIVKQVSDDTVRIIPDGTVNEAAGAPAVRK